MGFRPVLLICGICPVAVVLFVYTSDRSTGGDSVTAILLP